MEQTSFAATIQKLKLCVNEMLIERNKLSGVQETALPSLVWVGLVSPYSYLMNLSEADFRNIRIHTGQVVGNTFTQYWHTYPPIDPEDEAKKRGYAQAIENMPEAYWIGEPPTPGMPKPLGVNYRGRVVNTDIGRYQQCISSLYHAGALQSILEAKKRQLIVEVGGGYGGLAHHIGRILGRQATYVIVDLPELFLFQGAYLAVNNPEKSIYIYDSKTFTPEFVLQDIYDYDFVLIPNFALSKLHLIREIALMINQQSFQEMTEQQVQEYLEFGAKRLTQYLYSDNADRYPYNEDLVSVSTILEKYFDLYPPASYYDQLFKDTHWHWVRYSRKYLGIPKDSSRAFPKTCRIASLPQREKLSLRDMLWSDLRLLASHYLPTPIKTLIRKTILRDYEEKA